jgi:DNA-binding response OmpR family regulator
MSGSDINGIHLIILDMCGSEEDNRRLLLQIKARTLVPVFVHVRSNSEILHSYYLDIGADACIPYPIPVLETISRINATLRRYNTIGGIYSNNTLSVGPFQFRMNDYRVFVDDREVSLTPTEFDIIKVFLSRQNTTISREQFKSIADSLGKSTTRNTLNIHINRLRNKLKTNDGRPLIETVWGIGYRMNTHKFLHGTK